MRGDSGPRKSGEDRSARSAHGLRMDENRQRIALPRDPDRGVRPPFLHYVCQGGKPLSAAGLLHAAPKASARDETGRSETGGYERITRFVFDGYDDLGYPCRKTLVCEMLGKYANLLLLDGKDKILSVLRPVDFSMSTVRQLLSGMIYALPPK